MRVNRSLENSQVKEAFELVRAVLAKGPLPARRIIDGGIKLHPTGVEHARQLVATNEKAKAAKRLITEQSLFDSLLKRRDAELPEDSRSLDWSQVGFPPKPTKPLGFSVPAGHPFISATVLRRRILPMLISHRLVELKKDTNSKSVERRPFKYGLIPDRRIRSPGQTVGEYWKSLLANVGDAGRLRAGAERRTEAAHQRGLQLTGMDPEIWTSGVKRKAATKKLRRKDRQRTQWVQFLAQRPFKEWPAWEKRKKKHGQLALAPTHDHLKTRKRKNLKIKAEDEVRQRSAMAEKFARISRRWQREEVRSRSRVAS